MTHNNAIGIDYTDQQLHVLVEEYISQHRGIFTIQAVCSYVLYWAMEDSHIIQTGHALYESNQLSPADCNRVSHVLELIVREGRIVADGESFHKI